jgi:putrescine transport system substrate-binding protein
MNQRIVFLVALTALAACERGGQSDKSADSGAAAASTSKVKVYNWIDYVAEDTLAKFDAAHPGFKVEYSTYDDMDVPDQAAATRASGYDLMFPGSRPYFADWVRNGYVTELDKSRLPNLKNIDSALLNDLRDIDPGNRFGVPYMWGTVGLGINVTKVREILGADAALDTWSLVFDPARAEKLAACGIGGLDDQTEIFTAMHVFQGRNPADAKVEQVQQAAAALEAVAPFFRKFDSGTYKEELAKGTLCVAIGFNGDMYLARDEHLAAGGKDEIRYFIPSEGAGRWVDVMTIPLNAPNPEGAYAFLNYMLEPAVAASISNHVSYATANAEAGNLVSLEVRDDPGIYPDPATARKLRASQTPRDAVAAHQQIMAWNRIRGLAGSTEK